MSSLPRVCPCQEYALLQVLTATRVSADKHRLALAAWVKEELAPDLRALEESKETFEREKKAVLRQASLSIEASHKDVALGQLLSACGGNQQKLGKYMAMVGNSNGNLDELGRQFDLDYKRQEGELLHGLEAKNTLMVAMMDREIFLGVSQHLLKQNNRLAEGGRWREVERVQGELALERERQVDRLREEAIARIEEGGRLRMAATARQMGVDAKKKELLRKAADAHATMEGASPEQVAWGRSGSPPPDESRSVLATMLDEVMGCERELGALRDNFERDREAVLDEEYRRMEEALSSCSGREPVEAAHACDLGSFGLHETFSGSLDKLGQYMDQEYTRQVICPT